jgi:hypothetical protein
LIEKPALRGSTVFIQCPVNATAIDHETSNQGMRVVHGN